MSRLVLIDGNAILHRAYHALPPLTAPDGSPVNAVYGFTSILLKIWQDLKPTYIAVAFDRPAPTFRKSLYKEYQATRPKMDEDLVGQVGKVHEMVRAFGIPIYEKDGYEADDVIGTIAKQATGNKEQETRKGSDKTHVPDHLPSSIDEVIIVTGDRDLMQLIDDHTKLYMPVKGVSEAKLFGVKEAKERIGVLPEQIPDFKGLAGDASDNYPGIAGIGPKTAIELLAGFGSLERLLRAVKERDPKVRKLPVGLQEKLQKGIEDAVLSHELATVKKDVPLDESIRLKKIETLDTQGAREELDKFRFKSLLKRLQGDVVPGNRSRGGLKHEGRKKEKGLDGQMRLV
ncbi:hypothetical protein M1555_04690 [Patescibacteria group bacterium]|nr:hypothetical protein [Patescibacteria group bacterium]